MMNPFAPPGAAPLAGDTTVEVLERYRQRALIGAYALLGPWSLASATNHRELDILLSVTIAGDVLFWCVLDARLRGKTIQHGYVLPFLAVWPISLAIYLVWTRRARGLLSYAAAVAVATVVVGAAIAIESGMR